MDASQAAQPSAPPTVTAEVGDEDLLVVPHDGEVDLSLAVDDDPDLTPDCLGELGEVPGQFRRDDLLRGDPAAVDALQGLYLACPQTVGVTVYSFNMSPLAKPPEVALWSEMTLWSEPPPGDDRDNDYNYRCNRLYTGCQ